MNILITGANGGLGFELAKTFLNNGHTVIALSRNNDQLDKLPNSSLKFIRCDLSDREDVEQAIQKIQNLQALDILINNASVLIKSDVENVSWEAIDRSVETNLSATIKLTSSCIPHLRNSKYAHIVNISSMSGVSFATKFPGMSIYGATKGAINAFTEALAVELEIDHIHVNAIALSAMETPMLDKAFPKNSGGMSPSDVAGFIYDISLKHKPLFNGKIIPVGYSIP